jgi:hypothetical protein
VLAFLVDTAEAAGRHDVNAYAPRQKDRGGDGCRASLSGRDCAREVARTAFRGVRRAGEVLELIPAEPDFDPAVEDGNGRGFGARVADGVLHRGSKRGVARPRYAVADQGRLQRHHATAVAQRALHLVGGVDRHGSPRICAARSGLRAEGIAS